MVVQQPQLTLPEVWNEETKTGRWVYKDVLGEGGFGVVHQALDMKNGGKPVAIKILRCGKDGVRHCLLGTKEVRQARLFQEKVYSKTKHRLFLQYIEDHTGLDVYSDEELQVFEQPKFDWENDERVKALNKAPHPYLVMELIQGRCVKSLTKERKLTFPEIRELMHQASAALWHLYKQKKIHRDFRVHNMMWHEGKLTIIDFGLVLSAEPQHSDSKNRLVRTYWKLDSYWMPPEVKKPQLKSQISTFVPYNFAKNCPSSFDMYSFGVMALELLLDSSVNAKMARNQNAIEGKGLKRLKPLDAVKFTDETKLRAVGLSRQILNLCCARNPAHRPTPEMLLKGFQSEFPQGPQMSASKETFFRHLHQACGQNRAEKGMKMLGYLAREIVLHAANIEDYVDAMLIFTNEQNVSIYRLLCIVDCACRSGGKWATQPNTMELVIGAFAKVIKRMMEAARKLYSADTASNKFNRHKVIEFAKKWKEMRLFERPFGKPKPPPTQAELDKQALVAAQKKKAQAHIAAKKAAQAQAAAQAAAEKKTAAEAAAVAARATRAAEAPAQEPTAEPVLRPAPVAAPTPAAPVPETEDVAMAAVADAAGDRVVTCESVGSIGSWSSFTVSALTVKSGGGPVDDDVDVLSSESDDGVVEVASHTADVSSQEGSRSEYYEDEESEEEISDAPLSVHNKPLGGGKAWWMEEPDDKFRYANPKKRRERETTLAKKWFIENDEDDRYRKSKKINAPRRSEISESEEEEMEDLDDMEESDFSESIRPKAVLHQRHAVRSESSSVSSPAPPPAAKRRKVAARDGSSSSGRSEPPPIRRKAAGKKRRGAASPSESSSKGSMSISPVRKTRRAAVLDASDDSSVSPVRNVKKNLRKDLRKKKKKKKRASLSESSDASPAKRGRERLSSLPPPTRRRGAVIRPGPQYRSPGSGSSSPHRRQKPRNCLASEASDSVSRSKSPKKGVVLVARRNVSPRHRSNSNGNLFPKFPESRF